MVADDVTDDQIENFLACKDISELWTKSVLKDFSITGSINVAEETQANVCKALDLEEMDLKLFETIRGKYEAMNLCLELGGHLYSSASSYQEVLLLGQKHQCSFIWVPLHYDTEEMKWLGDNEFVPTTNIDWSRNYPKNVERRTCANLNVATGKFENERCPAKQCHYCYLGKTTQFSLTGICADSIIDQNYTLYMDPVTQKIQWKGFGKTDLIQNISSKQWEIVQVHEPFGVIGWTLQDTPQDEFYPLGDNKWEIFNDTCIGLKNTAEKDLLFTSCNENQFACSDAGCVDLEQRCDLFQDCKDKSDETGCHVLSQSNETYKGYEINFPTLPSKGEQISLNLSVDIDQLVNVKDLDLKFEVKFTLKIKWFDVQLTWMNLMNESTRNFLSKKEIEKIWKPKVQFGNSENINPIAIDNSATIYVEKNKPGKSRILPSEKHRALYYEGAENPLVYSRVYQEKFFCNFDYRWFPFDTQICDINFTTFNSMHDSVNLIPQTVNYTGEKTLMIFTVVDYLFANNTATDNVIMRIQ